MHYSHLKLVLCADAVCCYRAVCGSKKGKLKFFKLTIKTLFDNEHLIKIHKTEKPPKIRKGLFFSLKVLHVLYSKKI